MAAAEGGALERGIGCTLLRQRRIHVLLVRHVVVVEAGVVVVVVEAGDGGDGAQQLLWLLVQIFVLRHRWTSWSSNFRRSETSNGRLTSEYGICVVNFDQLPGAGRSLKLVEILFCRFQPYLLISDGPCKGS